MKYLLPAAAVTLLLSACTRNEPPVPVAPVALNTLTGTLVEVLDSDAPTLQTRAWTGGAGTVQVVSPGADDSDVVVASGTLQANGAFSVALKAPTSPLEPVRASDLDDITNAFVTGLLDGDIRQYLNCTGQPVLSDAAAQATYARLKVDASKDGYALPVTLSGNETDTNASFNLGLGVLMYADRAVTFTGSEVCTLSEGGNRATYTTNYDLRLAQGWNKVSFRTDLSATKKDQDVTVTISTSSASGYFPSDNWVYMGAGDVAVPLSLPGQALR